MSEPPPLPPPEDPLPYQSPHLTPPNPLQLPAVLLITFGSLTLLAIALDLITRLLHPSITFTFGIHVGSPDSTICFNALSVLLLLPMIAGATQMLRLRNYPLAFASSILAIIPLTATCCCILTLPVGIWSLVLLNRPEIKSRFH